MSAASGLSSILGLVTDNIGDFSSKTNTLLSKAAAALEGEVKFPDPGVLAISLTDYSPKYSLSGLVDGLPDITGITSPPPPPTYNSGGIAPPPFIGADHSGPPQSPESFEPTPLVPNDPVTPPPPFEPDPSLWVNTNSGGTPPLFPSLVPGFTPLLLDISKNIGSNLRLELPELSLIPIDVDFPDVDIDSSFSEFQNAIMGGVLGIPGINELSAEASQFSDRVLELLSSDVQRVIAERFDAPQATVNALKEVTLQTLFQQRQQELEQQRQDEIRTLTHRSGWVFPRAIQQAIDAQTRQLLDSWLEQAGTQQRLQQMEHAQKLFEVCADVYTKLREFIENFRSKEVEMILTAHQDAIQYAKKQIQVLAKIFDLEHYRKYDFELKKLDALLKQFEAQFQIDASKYEFIKAEIELEKLKQEQDGLLVKQYSAEADVLKTKTSIVQQQIEAVKQEIKLKEFPIQKFKARIDVFAAQVNAEEANLRKMLAEIDGNQLLVEQELMKLKKYEAEIKAAEEYFNACNGKTEVQIATNRAMMSAYEGTSKAATLPVEYSLLNANYDLYTHQINAENYLSDGELAVKIKEMDLDFMKQKRELRDELLRDLKELSLDIAEGEVDRKKAVADVSMQCANVMASMAEGAMSAGNLVSGVILQEYT